MSTDFLNNLPSPGTRMFVPGGVMWCESRTIKATTEGTAHGEIVFCFQVDAETAPLRDTPKESVCELAATRAPGYPPIEFCVRIIAAKTGAKTPAVAAAILEQAKELGIPVEQLVHSQYRTAMGLEADAKIPPPAEGSTTKEDHDWFGDALDLDDFMRLARNIGSPRDLGEVRRFYVMPHEKSSRPGIKMTRESNEGWTQAEQKRAGTLVVLKAVPKAGGLGWNFVVPSRTKFRRFWSSWWQLKTEKQNQNNV